MMDSEQVADTVAKTLAFAAAKASSPLFTDFRAEGNEVFLRINLPGLKLFRLVVEEVE